jgi:hypothetical protein
LRRLASGYVINTGTIAFWGLVVAQTTGLLPQAIGEEAPPSPSSVWGVVGLRGYPTGEREAANGLVFDPLVGLTSDINIGLLPRKQLYLFWQSDFWVQRRAAGAPAASQREFDADLGVAWNYFDSLELRASAYALNNLNRGSSLARPDGYKDGWKIDNRYYFGSGDIYDVGTLPFIDVGYYPSGSLVGNNGQVFHPGFVRPRIHNPRPPDTFSIISIRRIAADGAERGKPSSVRYRHRFGHTPFQRSSGLRAAGRLRQDR